MLSMKKLMPSRTEEKVIIFRPVYYPFLWQ